MSTYDFRALNDKEFESLAVALLSAELGIRIERFKPGKDQGVDGRWFSSLGQEQIVQAKHWIGSGYERLIAHLEKLERPKLDRLQCARYVVVTSVPLSRVNKQKIAATLAPYIKSESDVIGAEDLNDLLARHPAVERVHYKLWLSSSNTLALMMNHAIAGRSRAELEQIRHLAPLYVPTLAHASSSKHLNERRVLVLTGEPGIGKTTLAEQLVLEHVADGFELVVLEESISEAEDIYSEDAKQIFYFDDFLGRTFLEAIRAKQDSHILRFMSRIARDPLKRFILASRTNILNQGMALSDLYGKIEIVKNTYELNVGTLNTLDRAHILYNHIWHSDLNPEFVDELYADKLYHQIIKHKNYSPRLVSFVVDAGKVAAIPPTKYWEFVQEAFQNPEEVWSHFFSAQLSQPERDLMNLVVLNGGTMRETELRASFFALPSAEPQNEALNDSRFWKAVRHTSGSVLNRNIAQSTGAVTYALYNPSIADFVQSQLNRSGLWAYYFRAIRTLPALLRLEQLKSQPFFGGALYRSTLQLLGEVEEKQAIRNDFYDLRLSRLLAAADSKAAVAVGAIRRWMSIPLNLDSTLPVMDYASLMKFAIGIVEDQVLVDRASELAEYLEDSSIPIDTPEDVADLLATVSTIGATEACSSLRALVIRDWREVVHNIIAEAGILASHFDPDETDEAEAELRDFVLGQFAGFGIDLDRTEVTSICYDVDLTEIIYENIKVAAREDEVSDRRREYNELRSDDSAVDDLVDRHDR